MKKALIIIVVLAAIGFGLVKLANTRGSILDQEGKLARVEQCHIQLPVSASCVSAETRRIQIKSKASGTLEEITVREGDLVKKGDLLLRLEKREELRSVERAQQEVDRLRATVAEVETAHRQAIRDLPLNIKKAEASLKAFEADLKNAEFNYNNIKSLYEQGDENERALVLSEANYLRTQANVSGAQADLERAQQGELDVERALNKVKQAEASLAVAEQALKDSQQRLDETSIFSPIDGLVLKRFVDEGTIVSSATTTFTGGTSLLELADISEIIVRAQVDEADIDRVSQLYQEGLALDEPDENPVGQTEPARPDEVSVEFEGLRDRLYVGRIMEIAQEPEDRASIITYDVRIVLYDTPALDRVRLGMQGTVDFRPIGDEGLCVDYRAVSKKNDNLFVVFVPEDKNGRLEPVEKVVEVGLSDGVKVIVKSGLEEGQDVYVEKPRRFGPGGEHPE